GLPANVATSLTPGATFDAGVFNYLSAFVNGRVQDSFGVGLAGVVVEAQDGGGFYNEVSSSADGTFSLNVHVGTSFLHFSDLPGYEKPAVVTLANLGAGVAPTPVVAVYGNGRVVG